ncbi:MAG: response regulator [Methanobacteriota archaeon]|nr:MAG: response regulator [Euryarchaeota archaeon]
MFLDVPIFGKSSLLNMLKIPDILCCGSRSMEKTYPVDGDTTTIRSDSGTVELRQVREGLYKVYVGSDGRRILLVDDEADLRTVYGKMLEKAGYEVITAVDGEDALEKVERHKPHLVILDIMMPGMSGWDLARRIKESAGSRELPIIALSVKSDINAKMTSAQSGVQRHLAKPISQAELIGTVRTILNDM